MRLLPALLALLLVGCSQPAPRSQPQANGAKPSGYDDAVARLASMNKDANALNDQDRQDAAAKVIADAELIANQIQSVPEPDLPALEALTDLDDLYGRMLLKNRHYGEARLLFQKNLARWKFSKVSPEESARRLKQANDEIAECDKHILQ